MKVGVLATLMILAALPARADVSPAGLKPLPCRTGPLQPVDRGYCARQRHYVTPAVGAALAEAAAAVSRRHPGAVVRYMEASWPSGVRPMPPHLSHGDGRQIDLALFYEDRRGHALPKPPKAPDPRLTPGYGAYEPPRPGTERVCAGQRTPHDRPDPPASRTWRLNEARTAELVRRLADDPRVRRIFIEPHLKARLGFQREGKVRFAGCAAARHDDHIHVDFY